MTKNFIEEEWKKFIEDYKLPEDINNTLKLIIKEIGGEDYSRNTDYYDGFRDAMNLALYEIFIHDRIDYHTSIEDTLSYYSLRADNKIDRIIDEMAKSANRRED